MFIDLMRSKFSFHTVIWLCVHYLVSTSLNLPLNSRRPGNNTYSTIGNITGKMHRKNVISRMAMKNNPDLEALYGRDEGFML